MNLFEKNLRVLGKRNPELLSFLTENYLDDTKLKHYSWDKNRFDEDIVYIGQRRIGSCYSNEYLIKQWIQQYELEETNICLFGMVIPQVFDELQQYVKPENKLFIYEPDAELFLQLIERVDVSVWLGKKNVYLTIGRDPKKSVFQKLEDFFEDYQPERECFCTMFLPGYSRIYEEESKMFDRELFQWLYYKEQNLLTTRRFFEQDIEKPLQRICYYKEAIIVERLKSNWDVDMPVVIVAAGPSLRKNIGELKRAKGHALIVAVARAVLYLKEEKIIPDIIVDIDESNAYETVDEKYRNVPLMGNSCIGEETFYWNQGRKIMILDKPFLQRIKKEIGFPMISYGYYGSCAIAAFAVFAMLGTKKIILVGQDLAFGEDGNSHAEGVREDIDGNEVLPGYYGGTVLSRSDWYGFWCWYKRTLHTFPDCMVFNATEGGASIPDTVQIPLKEVVDQIEATDLDTSFLQEERYQVSEQEYDQMLAYLQKAKVQFQAVSQWNEKMYNVKKLELKEMLFYPILHECMYVSEERDEWSRFQEAVKYMKSHGWMEDKVWNLKK